MIMRLILFSFFCSGKFSEHQW